MPHLITSSPRLGHLAFTALLTIVLSACGGGGSAPAPADPLASFKQQKLDWQPCDPTILGVESAAFNILGDRARCALMRAPLDYAKPTQGELTVALLKVSAEQPQQRAGMILFNPGGPGGDGLYLAPQFGVLWSDANPNSPSGKTLKDLSNRYDLIGFSPRGLGASSRLYCASNELLQPANDVTIDRSESNISAVLYNNRLYAQACLKNPMARAINTDATARDMDLVRELAGDARLNYIGYSYGTWLGAWYARLFPERVGRMLLDSSMNVEGSYKDAEQLSGFGFHRIFNDIVAPYAARHPDWYGLGSDAEGVRLALQTLPTDLKSWVLDNLKLNKSTNIGNALIALRAATAFQELIVAQPHATQQELLVASASSSFIPDPANDAEVHLAIASLLASSGTPQRQSVLLEPPKAVRLSIICNDLASTGDEAFWVSQGNQDAISYPGFGGEVTNNPCLQWGGTTITRPAWTAATQAAPILMLQSRFDGPTPIEGANVTLSALPKASMIVIENEYSHGLFPYDDDCADPQVGTYFATGQLPPRTGSCPGKPLLGETTPFTVNTDKAAVTLKSLASSSQARTASKGIDTYNDPKRAAEIMRSIHQQIIPMR